MQQLDRIAETPRGWRQAVFDTADDAYFAQGAMPPGSVAQLHRALDTMRAEHADDAIIDRAEAIAVTLHRLLAVLRETPGDAVALISIRRELRAMGVDWLKAMPVFH